MGEFDEARDRAATGEDTRAQCYTMREGWGPRAESFKAGANWAYERFEALESKLERYERVLEKIDAQAVAWPLEHIEGHAQMLTYIHNLAKEALEANNVAAKDEE